MVQVFFAPGCQSKLLKCEMGVKYVCKNVTRKHNFLAPIDIVKEKLDLFLKHTEEKSMRKWAHI